MKKLFFIINSYSKGGGAEALLTKIVNNLDAEKYEIGIMEIIHDTIKEEKVNDNIKIYPYYVKADDPQRKAKMYYVYHEWDKVIAEYIPQDYDLYISFNYLKPSFLLPPGKKNIAWIHSDVYDLLQERMKEERELQNMAFHKANKIVAISDITMQSLAELFPEHKDKFELIYNGVDINEVRKKSLEPTDIKLQHPALLSIGRLDKRKNPLRLLNIFEQAHRKNPDLYLYYLGYGDLEESVMAEAEKMNLLDKVHLLGYYDNPFPIITQCDVVCMFSESEGFPMALLEGVALDKPFVSSVIGGAGTLANDQRCGRIAQSDEEAVNDILEVLQLEKETIQKECRSSIERFELTKYIKKIEKMLDILIET